MAGKGLLKNFASAGLVALVIRALASTRPDLLPAGTARPDPMKAAILPAAFKRDLLDDIVGRAGIAPLLHVGKCLDLAEDMPTFQTLCLTQPPGILADKWMRLERYHHATNRTRIAVEPDGLSCRRHATHGAPALSENALIAGLLAGLCVRSGARDVTLVIEGCRIDFAGLSPSDRIDIASADAFSLTWTAWPDPGPEPADAAAALSSLDGLRQVFAADIGRSWRIGDAARALAMSPRSLQRHLSQGGRSFSSVLRQARVNAAGAMLTGSGTPLAEIGYCCGYADQAHFQRDFRRALNVTPSAFRAIAQTGAV